MIELIKTYLGTSASTHIIEVTAAVLLICFVLQVTSMCFGIINKIFR